MPPSNTKLPPSLLLTFSFFFILTLLAPITSHPSPAAPPPPSPPEKRNISDVLVLPRTPPPTDPNDSSHPLNADTSTPLQQRQEQEEHHSLLLGTTKPQQGRTVPTVQLMPDGREVLNVSTQLCGTRDPGEGFKARVEGMRGARGREKRGLGDGSELHGLGLQPRVSTAKVIVDTYFHLVTTRDMSKYFNERLRKSLVQNQAAALNAAYSPSGIAFRLNPYSYTIRDDWATDASSTKMKQALRRGKYASLNVYFQTNLSSSPGTPGASTLLGYCTLPTPITYTFAGATYEYPASDWATDGCNVLAGSMPGSPHAVYGYDRGKTAVHEVGHWMGLLHTFQDNSCAKGSKGDYVDDTPQEGSSTVGCPRGKDTCPGIAGLDPITNYMDYSDDECYTGFTPDQTQRMKDMYTSLRQGH